MHALCKLDTHQHTRFLAHLQLLYGLNGRPRRQPDGVPPPPDDWLAWAEQAIKRAPQPSSLPLDPAEARAPCPARHPCCHILMRSVKSAG